jgi:hypothetical protein
MIPGMKFGKQHSPRLLTPKNSWLILCFRELSE